MSLNYPVVSESKDVLDEKWCRAERTQLPARGMPTGQVRDSMSINKNRKCHELKYIK